MSTEAPTEVARRGRIHDPDAARFEILEVEGPAGFGDAALIQRTCRRAGRTVRSMIDCLVAAMALREAGPLLARDRDYECIAKHTHLELVADPR